VIAFKKYAVNREICDKPQNKQKQDTMMFTLHELNDMNRLLKQYQDALKSQIPTRITPTITLRELSDDLNLTKAAIKRAIEVNDHLPKGKLKETGRKDRCFSISEARQIRSHFSKNNPLLITEPPKGATLKSVVIQALKGGVGKTTISVNFSAFLARRGYSVAMLDLDLQGSATAHIEAPAKFKKEQTIAGFYSHRDINQCLIQDEKIPLLHYIPANYHIESLNIDMALDMGENTSEPKWLSLITDLQKQLDEKGIQFLIIDSAPNQSLHTLSASFYSDYSFIPIPPKSADINAVMEYLPILHEGLSSIESISGQTKSYTDFKLIVSGYEKQKNASTAKLIDRIFGDSVLHNKIRLAEAFFSNPDHYLQMLHDVTEYSGSPTTLKNIQSSYDDVFEEMLQVVTRDWIQKD